jgi:hypothetical protein
MIVDKTFGTYKKVMEKPGCKGKQQEVLGIVPVVTTAANALLAQNIIQVKNYHVRFYETIGRIYSKLLDPEITTLEDDNINANYISSSVITDPGNINNELVFQLNTSCKKYIKQLSTDVYPEITRIRELVEEISVLFESFYDVIISAKIEEDDSLKILCEKLNDFIEEFVDETDDEIIKNAALECKIDTTKDTIRNLVDKTEEIIKICNSSLVLIPEDGDDTLPDTVSL